MVDTAPERTPMTDPTIDFERFFRAHRDRVATYVIRRYRGDVPDVVDEVFLIAWRKYDTLPADDQARQAWLYATARRVIANRVRWRARLDRFSTLSEPLSSTESPDVAEHDVAVHEALASLRERDRELLLLVEWDGLTIDAAADALQLPSTTITARLRAAREAFRRSYQSLSTTEVS